MIPVGIIGAGAAGLCAARHLLCSNQFRPILFEKSSNVGGTWVYTDDPASQHATPLYKNMISNLPKQVMQFPDLPFENLQPTFLPHQEVLKYLQRYCKVFEIFDHIKLNHAVENVVPIKMSNSYKQSGDTRWKVTVRDLTQNRLSSYDFEALFVCNGHYSDSYKPRIPGIENFKGAILHSCEYRKPNRFANENVLIIGAGASGVDIALDLARVANKVYLSYRGSPIESFMPANVIEVSEVESFKEDGCGVNFRHRKEDKSISAVILCTGYSYSYPFLDGDCGITFHQNYVHPLFNHVVNINNPSMMFIGVPVQIPPFRLFNMQVLYALGILTKQINLPTTEEMLQDCNDDLKRRFSSDQSLKAGHNMTGKVIQYMDILAKSGVENIPDNIINMYHSLLEYRKSNLMSYKARSFSLDECGTYRMDKN